MTYRLRHVRDLVPRCNEYDAHVLVILAIAAIAILVCVVLVSLGKGGELTEFPPDVPSLDLPEAGQLTAADVMAIHLPVNLVGYHTQSVDETLRRAAGAISARDNRIAVLEQRVSELLSNRLYARQESYAAPGAGPRTEHAPEAPAVSRELPESGDPVTSSGASVSWDGGARLTSPPEDPEWRVPGVQTQHQADARAEAPGEPVGETEAGGEAAGEAGDQAADTTDTTDTTEAAQAKADEKAGDKAEEKDGEPERDASVRAGLNGQGDDQGK